MCIQDTYSTEMEESEMADKISYNFDEKLLY